MQSGHWHRKRSRLSTCSRILRHGLPPRPCPYVGAVSRLRSMVRTGVSLRRLSVVGLVVIAFLVLGSVASFGLSVRSVAIIAPGSAAVRGSVEMVARVV